MPLRLPASCLVVLVGASGSGKTTWAEGTFTANQIVSSDRLRAVVGVGEDDQAAGTDAFALLDQIVDMRLGRRLLTVIDTIGLDDDRRARYREVAARHGLPCHAVVFPLGPAAAKERNAARERPLKQRVIDAQLRRFRQVAPGLDAEGFAAVHVIDDDSTAVAVVAPALLDAPVATARQRHQPLGLRFGLQLSSFPGGAPAIARNVTGLAVAAERAGFSSVWVMDHFRQIPQVGRAWDDMLEPTTTLAFLAAVTERVTLGTLVASVVNRHPAMLGKAFATLDVLCGGRAVCGLGIGWFQQEAAAYGYRFPPVAERYAMLEDTVEVLRAMWGPGSPSFQGRTISVPEAMAYPRPIQPRLPILIGGCGERTTLRLVARHADLCNLRGDPEAVAAKLTALDRHCAAVGRDRAEIEVTHLSTAFAAPDRSTLADRLSAARSRNESAEQAAVRLGAGIPEDLIGRFRLLSEAGVQHLIIPVAAITTPEDVTAFAEVTAAFS
ncbi:MAG: TIGR03560 family F420-dependent LLM class oxidoreductase [Acidimicrobiia bacterium]|nr:TIGR03560 family F420-dependent LLM class oxidoreductase [Acidimicrobiia bacterium]